MKRTISTLAILGTLALGPGTAMAETIYVPSYQERPHELIEYGVNWLLGREQSRPVKMLPPEESFADCQYAIESDSGFAMDELKQWHCTPYSR